MGKRFNLAGDPLYFSLNALFVNAELCDKLTNRLIFFQEQWDKLNNSLIFARELWDKTTIHKLSVQ